MAAKNTKKEKGVVDTTVTEVTEVVEETKVDFVSEPTEEVETEVVEEAEETTKEDVIEAVEKLGETVQEIVTETEESEQIESVEELQKEVEELVSGKEEVNDKLTEEPKEAEAFIKAEIKKAEVLKEKVEKAIKRSNLDFTNSWNGQTYDF